MNLTKEQEKKLIEYALSHLLNGITPTARVPWNKGLHGTTKTKWSASQHRKFSKTMKAKWAERKAKETK